MATSCVDNKLKRIAGEVLAGAGSILVVETQALAVLQACCRTVQTWSGVGANQLRLIGGTHDWSSWSSVI